MTNYRDKYHEYNELDFPCHTRSYFDSNFEKIISALKVD